MANVRLGQRRPTRHAALRFLLVTPALVVLIALGTGAVSPALAQPAPCGDGIGPCRCGDSVRTNTRLAGSDPVLKTPCRCVGLFVATGVTLVIGGTIRAAPGNMCAGIVVPPHATDVVVTTGRIVGFEAAVGADSFVAGVRRSEFSRLQLVDNNLGIALIGDDNTVAQNVSIRSQFFGIAVSGAGNVVTLNRTEEGQHGFDVDGDHNVVSRNQALRHQLDGIIVSGEGAIVDRNRSHINGGAGFVIEGANQTVTLNLAEENESDGFFITADSSAFTRNRSAYNRGFGLDAAGVAGNTFTDNRCTGNAEGTSDPAGLCF